MQLRGRREGGLHMREGWMVSDEDIIQDSSQVHKAHLVQAYGSVPPDYLLTSLTASPPHSDHPLLLGSQLTGSPSHNHYL